MRRARLRARHAPADAQKRVPPRGGGAHRGGRASARPCGRKTSGTLQENATRPSVADRPNIHVGHGHGPFPARQDAAPPEVPPDLWMNFRATSGGAASSPAGAPVTSDERRVTRCGGRAFGHAMPRRTRRSASLPVGGAQREGRASARPCGRKTSGKLQKNATRPSVADRPNIHVGHGHGPSTARQDAAPPEGPPDSWMNFRATSGGAASSRAPFPPISPA